ncbi:MAG: hypothetical protein ACYTET_01400 [Planctomycetota bacterium]|jgi:ATP-dependent protease HslVU (ClpYQ) ATPase subunit
MNNRIKTVCFVLMLGLAFTIAGCRKEPDKAQDIESVRENLREQVANGELTREEAIVKLAEAKANFDSHEKGQKEFSPELEALGKELKEKVDSGQMSEDEAKTAWIEAAKKAKVSSSTKKGNDSK